MVSRKRFFKREHRYMGLLLSVVFATATSTPIHAQPQIPLLSQSLLTTTPSPSEAQPSRQAFGGQVAVFLGHKDTITSAEFSPDGQRILTAASFDKTARLWDLQGNLLAVLQGHERLIYSATFSPDGRYILTNGGDRTARLWDSQGNSLAVLRGQNRSYASAVFSPNGQHILTNSEGKTARLWDLQGNILAVLRGHDSQIRSAVFSPDGQHILTASLDKTARLWNLQGNPIAVLRGHSAYISTAVFSSDGQHILTAGSDETARLWNLQGDLLTVFRGHENRIARAVFSPNGQHILTASEDKTARLWDLQGNLLAVLQEYGSVLTSAAFSVDGRYILTSATSDYQSARLWDRRGQLLAVLPAHQSVDGFHRAIFSPDGQYIFTYGFGHIARLWDISDAIATQVEQITALQALQEGVFSRNAQINIFQGHTGRLDHVAFSPDGQHILTASRDRTARLWNLQGNLLAILQGHTGAVSGVVFSPDSLQILTTSRSDNTVQLWDRQGNLVVMLQGHEGEVKSAVFSPDGQQILTASEDKTARLWDLQGNLLAVLRGHDGEVRSAIFTSDGQSILTRSLDQTARLWTLQGNPLAVLRGHSAYISTAVFSPDSQHILTSSADQTARLWDLQGNLLTVLRGHEDRVNSAEFSPDGRHILTISGSRSAGLWDRQGNLLVILRGHEDAVTSAKFSPNGRYILTASGDRTIRLWDYQGNLLALLRGHEDAVTDAEFSPNGRYILTASFDQTARLWDVSAAIDLQAEETSVQLAFEATVSDRNAPQAEAALQSAIQLNHQDTAEARQQGLQKLDEALNLYRTDNNLAKAAYTLLLIGNIYTDLGQFQAALDAYTEALPLSRQAGDRAEEAAILNRLGQLYTTLAVPETALDYHNQALPLLYQLNDKGGAAATFNNIGDIQADANEWEAARDNYTQALIISRPAGDLAAEATALSNIGSTYIPAGDWGTALNAYQQALIITRHLNDKIHESSILNQLGTIHAALGDNATALEHYNQALALAQQLGYKTEEADIFYNQARLNRQQNNLTAAKADIENAIEIVEALRSEIASQTLRQSYFARNQAYYQLYIDLLMQQHQQTPNQGYDALALHVSERARARSLLEQLTEAGLNLRADLDPALLAEEQRLTQALNAADQKRLDLLNSSYSNNDLEAVKAEIDAILQQLQRLEAQIRQANPAYANLRYPDPLVLADIQSKILDDKTLLLQYALGDERSYLFLVSKTSLKTYTLPPKAEIETAVEAYRALLQSPSFTDLSQGQQLSQMLLGQLADELRDQRLVIVGDGKLQLLPFAALPWGSGTSSAPLLANHEIITLPSVTSLAVQREQWQQRPQAPKTLAVLADPVFTANDPRLGENARTIVSGDLSREPSLVQDPVRNSCGDFARLPYTAAEAEQILALVPAAQQFSALGFDANHATATAANLNQYQIVHLATHGCIQDNPLLSNLALSFFQPDGQRAESSSLKLQDIYNLELNAELVVLSACQTGTGKEVQGEGIVGLTRGFMYAGARRIVVSLWSVNDRATSTLMGDYYRQMLQQGRDPAAALQQAQLAMWQSGNNSAPYYWAPFTIQGDW
ncbi:MAG: CHAT domain-containing protein [Phormidium sp. BM_Day4_Bin.17]|nr:CHAT domain-containing protein [Phormidium sp. BM_Day4_Bin.17]